MNSASRNIILCFLLIALRSDNGVCQSTDRERLAILPFGLKGLTAEEGLQLRQRFAEGLDESMRFENISLASIRNRLDEAGLKNIDSCTTFPCLAELGKLLTAEKVVYVSATRQEKRSVLHIQVVRSSDAALLYDERVDHTGEFSSLLSDVMLTQGQKLGKAYLDRDTPWYYVAGAVVVGIGLIYWIFTSWGTSSSSDNQGGTPPSSTH